MHQKPIKTCFLQIAAGSNELFSYHVLLKVSAKSHKAPHTPAHLLKASSLQECMRITFHTVALLQGVHAHRISFFQKYLQLQQIQMNLYENKQTHKHHSANTIFTSHHSKTVHDDFVSVECHHPPCIRPPRQKQSS